MRRYVAALALVALASGCAGTTRELARGFDPRVPRRVAVLPFVDGSSGDSFTAIPLAALLDRLPLAGDETLEAARAATVFREKVHANLTRTALDPLPLHVVDSLLVHQGLDVIAAYRSDRAAAARLLGEALAADAVLFGEVTAWDRQYLAVEAILEAGVDVELRDAVSGAVLYRASARDTFSSGITNVPVPIATEPIEAGVYAALEPIRGLSNTFFARLSDDVARQAIDGLAPDAAARAAAPPPTIVLATCTATPGDSPAHRDATATGDVTATGATATGATATGATATGATATGATATGDSTATGATATGATATGDSATGATATGDAAIAASDDATAASGDATAASGDATTAASGDATAASGDATTAASGDATAASGDATAASGDATTAASDDATGGATATGATATGATSTGAGDATPANDGATTASGAARGGSAAHGSAASGGSANGGATAVDPTGRLRALAAGDTVDVLVLADPGSRCTFSVGEGPAVPMVETAPGTYRGTLQVSPAHAWSDATLRVRLVSPLLRSTTLDLDRPRLTTAPRAGPQK